MPLNQSACEHSTTCDPRPSSGAPPCPVCGGALMPLRGVWRCTRCLFTLCAGCEPHSLPGGSDDE